MSFMVPITTCPICGASARPLPDATAQALCFRCMIDGDFEIDADCLENFRALDLATRHRVLNHAIISCDPDAPPCIAQSLIDKELTSESRAG